MYAYTHGVFSLYFIGKEKGDAVKHRQ